MKDNINPSHYTDMVIPPNVYIVKNNIPWYEANVIKYVSRHRKKNKLEDLRKAKKYLELLAKDLYEEDLWTKRTES